MILTVNQLQSTIIAPYSRREELTPSDTERITLQLMDLLTEKHVCDKFALKYLARFFTKTSYSELIDERNLGKICGWPSCNQQQCRVRDLYSAPRIGLPYDYLSSYCSREHYQYSMIYQQQLSDEAVFARKGVTTVSYGSLPYENIKLLEEIKFDTLGDLVQEMHNLTVTEKEDLHSMLNDLKIVENENPGLFGE